MTTDRTKETNVSKIPSESVEKGMEYLDSFYSYRRSKAVKEIHRKALKIAVQHAREKTAREIFYDIEDIYENYKGDYFKIDIKKVNKLKQKYLKTKEG